MNTAHLSSIINSDLNQPALLVVKDAVMSVLPVAIIIKLHSSCQAFWVFRWHQNPATPWNTGAMRSFCLPHMHRQITIMQTLLNLCRVGYTRLNKKNIKNSWIRHIVLHCCFLAKHHPDLLKSGPVFQMLVLPTQPRGGSVMFSFSKSSWMDWATTATASLMCADSFLPLMSWRPISPVCVGIKII